MRWGGVHGFYLVVNNAWQTATVALGRNLSRPTSNCRRCSRVVDTSHLPTFDRVDELSNVAATFRYLTSGFVIKRSYLTLLGSLSFDSKASEEDRKRKLRATIIAKWQVLLDEPPHTDRFFHGLCL